MTMTYPDPAPATGRWHVTGQSQRSMPGPTGRFVPGFTVQFKAEGLGTGSVFVPESVYSKATVAKMIAQKVATMGEIGGLSG